MPPGVSPSRSIRLRPNVAAATASASRVVGHVVDAEHVRAALERQHVGRDGARHPIVLGRPVSLPRKRLREAPITTGRPSATISSSRRSSSRLCSSVLPKPIPGSSQTRSSASPAPTANAEPLLEEGRDVRDDVVVARVVLHRARLAQHVHQAHSAPDSGHERRHARVAAERGDVVDERRARAASAARATGAFEVSIESGTRPARRAPRSRASPVELLLGATGSAPGRVDSPPMSMRSAPSRQRSACATAACGLEELPAVGERVRRHVEDAHHRRAGKALLHGCRLRPCRLPPQVSVRFGPSPRDLGGVARARLRQT